ncbi:MAG: UPF0280 family protein [Sneathiella sp.]
MAGEATARLMEDGRRLHLQHGPIDIVAEAFGAADEIEAAYNQGWAAFQSILGTLVQDLGILRRPVMIDEEPVLNGISADMWLSARPFADRQFVTPMAAVAGAVADHVKAAMIDGRSLTKLYVNNGGDISLHLKANAVFSGAIVENQDMPALDNIFEIRSKDDIGGVATSGWRGRSLSPGMADAVTVLAKTAAIADVAATLIAGAVVVKSAAVTQEKAIDLRDDTDLGDMLVTTAVGTLTAAEKHEALEKGFQLARSFEQEGWIKSAYMALQGEAKSLAPEKEQLGRKTA